MLTFNLLSAGIIEKIIQSLIKLDPDSQHRLKELEDKQVAIKLTDMQLTLIFDIYDDSIFVTSHSEQQPNVTMSGTSFAFFNLSATERGGDALFKGDIHFEGEVGTAQKFQNFWQQLHIDWEEELSKYTGDIVANQVGSIVKNTHEQVKKLFFTARDNTAEYLKEEARLTPSKLEAEDFFDELDDLKSDVERLAARVNRLAEKIHNQ
ncbi:SCP2 domain-containing protein [Pleionea sp. CnH1-48]|uniref:ubiquinone biosynthesis accessory factor UbiJ n=1 Tax=Pleionea sp. CnH1-48 TaxID=2954494 RepID=UPI0020971F69|nr:SCP2 sterol-binding domain-containing protein [Pleionea sp. CnH1-48]MCO7224514.1 SCP2 sterol-binding domain-containing protein [Pleionea sp. CnH1-48]